MGSPDGWNGENPGRLLCLRISSLPTAGTGLKTAGTRPSWGPGGTVVARMAGEWSGSRRGTKNGTCFMFSGLTLPLVVIQTWSRQTPSLTRGNSPRDWPAGVCSVLMEAVYPPTLKPTFEKENLLRIESLGGHTINGIALEADQLAADSGWLNQKHESRCAEF